MFRIRFWPILLAFALLPSFAATPARAMVFTALPGADVIANDGRCALREAIINANNNNQSGSTDCPAGQANATDSLVLLAGQTYSLTIDAPDNDADTANEGDLDVLNNLTAFDLQILSNGAANATIAFTGEVGHNNRVLEVRTGATVLLRSVTITGGRGAQRGGGVVNRGTLTLERVAIVDNKVPQQNSIGGGGIYTGPGSLLTLRQTSVVRDNVSLSRGGGLYNDGGNVTIEASTITDNSSRGDGGGIVSIGSADNPASLSITAASVVGNNRTIDDNGDGGGIWNGNKSTTVIEQSLVENNQSRRNGGAIAALAGGNVSVIRSTLNSNAAFYLNDPVAGSGGAVWNAGSVIVDGSTVSNNRAGKGANSHGGAFYNTGLLRLFNSAVYANQTQPGSSGDGGAVFNASTLIVLNTTLSGNTASGSGGAIRMGGGYADIRHATITANTATVAHGGLYLVGAAAEVDIKHSILAGNLGAGSAADCSKVFATLTSKGYNLVGTGCGSTFGAATNDLVGVDRKLTALADNDGTTKTHAPQIGSPVINAIPQAACTDNDWPQIATDQRGIARPQEAGCEIGAYEQKPLDIGNPNPKPALLSLAPNSIPQGGGDLVLVVTGEKFMAGSIVHWKGVARATIFVNATEVRATISAADSAFATTAVVTVFNPGPGGGFSNGLDVVVTSPDKQLQTIAFAALADRTLLEAPFALQATASSGLPVQPSASGACVISEGLVLSLDAGICTITIGQAGNAEFNPAVSVAHAFTIRGGRAYLPNLAR